MGSTKSTDSDRYTWLDKSPIDPKVWPDEPNKNGENALVLSSYSESFGQIREVSTSQSNRRICLINPIAPPTEPPIKPPTEPSTEPSTEPGAEKPTPPPPTPEPTESPVTKVPLPGKDLESKVEYLNARLNQQEKLLNDLVFLLKKAYGA